MISSSLKVRGCEISAKFSMLFSHHSRRILGSSSSGCRSSEAGGRWLQLRLEEKGRLSVKEEVLKQVQETGLFEHAAAFLSSSNSCFRNMRILGQQDDLPDIAASVRCQGAQKHGSVEGYCRKETCVKCLKDNSDKPSLWFLGQL